MYAQALADARDADDPYCEAVVLHNLGNVHRAQGRYRDALAYYQQSLDIDRGLGERNGAGIVHAAIGSCELGLGNHAAALEHFDAALAIHRATGEVHRDLGRLESALDHYRRALALRRTSRDTAGMATTLAGMGSLHDAAGQPEPAGKCWQEALELYSALVTRGPTRSAACSRTSGGQRFPGRLTGWWLGVACLGARPSAGSPRWDEIVVPHDTVC